MLLQQAGQLDDFADIMLFYILEVPVGLKISRSPGYGQANLNPVTHQVAFNFLQIFATKLKNLIKLLVTNPIKG